MQLQYGYVHTYLYYIYIYTIRKNHILLPYLFVSFITWIDCASFFRRIVWVESWSHRIWAMPCLPLRKIWYLNISFLISLFPHQMARYPIVFPIHDVETSKPPGRPRRSNVRKRATAILLILGDKETPKPGFLLSSIEVGHRALWCLSYVTCQYIYI